MDWTSARLKMYGSAVGPVHKLYPTYIVTVVYADLAKTADTIQIRQWLQLISLFLKNQ